MSDKPIEYCSVCEKPVRGTLYGGIFLWGHKTCVEKAEKKLIDEMLEEDDEE